MTAGSQSERSWSASVTSEPSAALRAGRRAHEIPKHGMLARTRQVIPADKRAGAAVPGESGQPVWMKPKDATEGAPA